MANFFSKIRYTFYVASKKIVQLPSVLSESTPHILTDEIVSPAIGDTYALITKYIKFGVTEDFIDLLDSLKRAGVNTVVVCNGKPSPADLDALRPHVHRILVRPNIGRDFGAYRAATLYLNAKGLRPGRVIYCNDSLYYIKGESLDHFVGKLAQGQEVTGATENHEINYHIGSFAIAVPGRAFVHPKVLRFWQRYRPYDLRPYAIRKGEMGLSNVLQSQGFRFDVIYRADKLAQAMQNMTVVELLDLVPYMQRRFDAPALLATLTELSDIAERIRGGASRKPEGGNFNLQRPSLVDETDAANVQDALLRNTLMEQILKCSTEGSQIHMGFGLFYRFFRCPIVKKDLIQRDIYSELELSTILADLPAKKRDDIIGTLLVRGRPLALSKRRRWKIDMGLE